MVGSVGQPRGITKTRGSSPTVKEGKISVSLDWQPISNEVRDSRRRGRIQVRQYRDDITWPGADLQLAIHPGRLSGREPNV